MTAGEGPSFHIEYLPKVNAQIDALAEKAKGLGFGTEFLVAFKTIVEQLKTRPLEWGDPERRTKKQGGVVCHGYSSPLYVRFVVYEVEHYVCILEIRPFPGSSLD